MGVQRETTAQVQSLPFISPSGSIEFYSPRVLMARI
ncbi:MAG: hypothetical protein ACI9C2_002524, partial [Gammaproteobacteria bacterium]